MTAISKNTSHETHNYVLGFVSNVNGDFRDGRAVHNPEKTIRLEIDHSEPITLARCAQILKKACALSQRPLTMISIRLIEYSRTAGNELGDWPETCYQDKRWDYTVATNSLIIFDRGEPVYSNDDGIICRDQAALHDSLGD